LEQIKLQSDLGMSHDVQKEGKLEGVEVLIIGSGVTIVRPRLSDEQRRRRTLLWARSSSGGGVPAEAAVHGEAAALRGEAGQLRRRREAASAAGYRRKAAAGSSSGGDTKPYRPPGVESDAGERDGPGERITFHF
jgi:hypothetical protein